MSFKDKLLYFLPGGCLILPALLSIFVANATPDEQSVVPGFADSEMLSADSIAMAETMRRSEEASSAYKNLKFVQYDGIVETELYPTVMDVYGKVQTALADNGLSDGDRTRFRGILLDIADLLKRGAIFYSSLGDSEKMAEFSTAYVDLRLDPSMQGLSFGGSDGDLYPALIYTAASNAYNHGEYAKAADYLEAYLATGDTSRREQVSLFLGQACINAGCPERAVDRLIDAVDLYPANFNLLMIALQACLDSGKTDRMQPLLTKALAMRPDDEMLLNVQGRMFENEGNFASAIDIFQRLYDMKPNSLPVNQHMALCYYNLGADYYNKAIMESEEKNSKRYSRQSQAYFRSAQNKLETVVENDPTNAKYLKALASTYACLGEKERLASTNIRLQALGIPEIKMNGMPESIAFADNSSAAKSSGAVPDYQEFARGYVEKRLAEFTKRGEFEKLEDYEKRVSKENVYQQYVAACRKAESDYLTKYSSRLRISDLSLQPYDVDNESYLIESEMGPIVVKVPLKNKEAETFKSGWNSIKVQNPKFFIKDNHVAIASVDLVTSAGKTYKYNAEQAANYDFTDVQVDVQSFIAQGNSRRNQGSGRDQSASSTVLRAGSDVDRNIPVTNRKAEKTVALIIANEDYKQVSKVESALNDAETFAKYCTMTLGIPESHVMLNRNVTYAEMIGALRKLRQLTDALGDGVDVIVYYAGHGFPDEKDKDAYLLPVDGDGFTTATSYPLKKLYSDLSSMGAENVMVFLDACFSGAARDGEMLNKARGVALKPKDIAPEGNMFILSAASDQETALPYREKNHGLFTYFLLKKLQESKGNVTLYDLSKYVEENVKKNSITVNSKLQTPRTTLSGNMKDVWTSKKLK